MSKSKGILKNLLHYELVHCHTQEHFVPLAAVRNVKEIIRHWEKKM